MVKVELILDNKSWLSFISKLEIKKLIKEVFNIIIHVLNISIANGIIVELSFILTDDDLIKNYNKKYRNIDNPTNVLSFPLYENEVIKEFEYNNNYLLLGDIVLSIDTIIRESKDQKKSFSDHLTHLILHSILHLFGFDHVKIKDAKNMESIEIEVLKKLGIDNPYK